MGYEFELLKMFADSMNLGIRVEIVANLDEAFEMLNKGYGDVLAHNLTVTKERKNRIAFTDYHNLVAQVLIQRKPDNWRDLKLHEIEKQLIRNPVDLIGKEVHVRYQSSYLTRMRNLSDEVGGDIIIIEDFPDVETEALIRKVADGTIDFTVAEEDVALVNSGYYPILDIQTELSVEQQIAWGLRKNSSELKDTLNYWLRKMKKAPDFNVLYSRYFKRSRSRSIQTQSEYSSLGGGKLSPYDDQIKEGASELGWDWKLIAAQIFKESQFDPEAVSWAGAIGLMQILPRTGRSYGVSELTDPVQNIQAGIKHMKWLQRIWEDDITDPEERKKFILASYNVGQGHVFDAIRLTKKYGGDTNSWEDVSEFLLKKALPKYYNDPVVEHGYCRGSEPVNYVKVIYSTYVNYMQLFPEDTEKVI